MFVGNRMCLISLASTEGNTGLIFFIDLTELQLHVELPALYYNGLRSYNCAILYEIF